MGHRVKAEKCLSGQGPARGHPEADRVDLGSLQRGKKSCLD